MAVAMPFLSMSSSDICGDQVGQVPPRFEPRASR
jgi:hypothetical protein